MGIYARATVGADMLNASSVAASSSRVFFTVEPPRRKDLGLHRENGVQKESAHTKRTFVLILKNVTKDVLYIIDPKWDIPRTADSEEFLKIENRADFPRESKQDGARPK